MEAALSMLAAHFECIVVRCHYRARFPVRLRKRLVDWHSLDSWLGRKSDTPRRQLSQWREKGGVYLNFRKDKIDDPHDAILFPEAPLHPSIYRQQSRATTYCAVVYKPPTWDEIIRTVKWRYPSEAICRRYWGIVRKCASIEVEELSRRLGTHPKETVKIGKAMFSRGGMRTMYEVYARVEPEDKSLLSTYHAIAAINPPDHLYTWAQLNKDSERRDQMFRALLRCGSMTRKRSITFYDKDAKHWDFRRAGQRHRQALIDLSDMIGMVNAAPEITERALRELRPARPLVILPSIFLEQPEAEEPARDTTD